MTCREIIDCESLITEVQKRPALYDFKLKEYSDKQVKEKLWMEVCEALFDNWIYLALEDKKGKVLLLQRRWKSLRECFRRELKAQNGKSGLGIYRKKYMYFNKLLFLTSTGEERPTCSNSSLPQCNQVEVFDEGTTEVAPIKSETVVRPQKQRKIKENTRKSFEEEPIDVLLKNKAQEDDIDEDKSFLMSLLPKFKKFSDDQKFEAQIEILKIMRRVHQKSTQIPSNECYDTMPSTHTSPLQTASIYISSHTQGDLPYQGQILMQHQLCKGERFTTMASIAEESSNKMFGGWQKVFSHDSKELGCKMKFGVYIPPQAETEKVPVVYWLSGLTCTEQNFVTKAGAQQYAAKHGFLVVAPDTSPRGCNIEGEEDSWDFGTGAGFYVDATEEKWKMNYRMFSYVTKELPELVTTHFKVQSDKSAIMGHSMGGHGALICALKNPGQYRSVSAFAPICNPINCPWGVKAFTGYLGDSNKEAWKDYDACELLKKYNGPPLEILVDQGKADNFLTQGQLLPDNLVSSCAAGGVPVVMRMQEDYDHSYYFIASFIADHFDHHAKFLKN